MSSDRSLGARVRALIQATFELPGSDLPPDAGPLTVERWDSLGHMELMMALEIEFGVALQAEEMLELTTVRDIEEFLRSRGVPDPA